MGYKVGDKEVEILSKLEEGNELVLVRYVEDGREDRIARANITTDDGEPLPGKPPEHSSAGGNPPEHAHGSGKPEKPAPKK